MENDEELRCRIKVVSLSEICDSEEDGVTTSTETGQQDEELVKSLITQSAPGLEEGEVVDCFSTSSESEQQDEEPVDDLGSRCSELGRQQEEPEDWLSTQSEPGQEEEELVHCFSTPPESGQQDEEPVDDLCAASERGHEEGELVDCFSPQSEPGKQDEEPVEVAEEFVDFFSPQSEPGQEKEEFVDCLSPQSEPGQLGEEPVVCVSPQSEPGQLEEEPVVCVSPQSEPGQQNEGPVDFLGTPSEPGQQDPIEGPRTPSEPEQQEEEPVAGPSTASVVGAATTGAVIPPDAPKFAEQEKVLSFSGPLLYEGVILHREFDLKENEFAYFIHYKGWNKNLDEWVLERLVLKYSVESLKLQRELKAEQNVLDSEKPRKMKASKSKKKTKNEPVESEAVTPAKKLVPPYVESQRRFNTKQEIKITIPEVLKHFLVIDSQRVGRNKKVAILPARQTIEQIFAKFLEGKNRDAETDKWDFDLCEGLRSWFISLCRSDLLYNREEREQFEKIRAEIVKQADDVKMQLTDYYGAAHLMRLFTQLGVHVARSTKMSSEMVERLQKTCSKFFRFMIQKYNVVAFENDYEDAKTKEQSAP